VNVSNNGGERMNAIVGSLAISVTISIAGVVAVSFSLSLDKLKAKVGISQTTGGYARGIEKCVGNCDPNEVRSGAKAYRSLTHGSILQTQVKVYDDGIVAVDKSVSYKNCYGKLKVCGKVGFKAKVFEYPGKESKPVPHGWPLHENRFQVNARTPRFPPSSKIYEQPGSALLGRVAE
jgi:hypothetical protein